MNNREEFLEAIGLGMDIESACYLVGLSPMDTYRLLERGKKEQERLGRASKALKPRVGEVGALELWKDVTRARAAGQRSYLQAIQSQAPDDWKAARFVLEHMNPQVFSSGGSVLEVDAPSLGEIEAF